MKKLLLVLFTFISSFSFSQNYDFQQLCITCAEAQGYYCGDDPTNWTQYSPNGCVQNSWLNDGWVDCVDAGDEDGAVPTTLEECVPPTPDCDTLYVEVPVVEYIYETDTLEIPFYIYETIIQLDTIVETEYITQVVIDTVIETEIDTLYSIEYITQIVVDTVIEEVEVFIPEYIYQTDTLWMEGALDTMYVDVIQEVEVIVYDTIVETEIEYVEFFVVDTLIQYDTIVNTEYVEIFVIDTIIEYVEVVETEYIDCDTGMPCGSSMQEIVDKSKETGLMYNLQGKVLRKPEGVYIEDGKIKYIIK
tara:strand:+ start:1125 stop:2036 length:912 start_codon:yes stop_codon:yes gene_type:complete